MFVSITPNCFANQSKLDQASCDDGDVGVELPQVAVLLATAFVEI
jgi:hypothetical protein